MYERKIPEDLECGINVTMKVFGGKWQPCIIDAINRGFKRPSELHKQINTAAPRVINMQLRELEHYGIIYKTVFEGLPLRVEYSLTSLGKSLLPIINAMNIWGEENRDHVLGLIEREAKQIPATAN